MKKLNNIFSEIKTPNSWKDNLFSAAYGEKKKSSRGFFKKFTVAAVAVLAVTACTITVGALTGVFDEFSLFKNGFKDEVSAEKIAEGKYQELNETVETENATIKATKFLGDSVECYTVFEVRLKNGVKADLIMMDIMGLDEDVRDVENYLGDTLHSIPVTNEETGETVYYFNVKNYETHVATTINDNSNMVYYIDSLCYVSGGNRYEEVTDTLAVKFNPDEKVLTDVQYDYIEKTVTVNGVEVNVYRTLLSDYRAQVEIQFTIPEDVEETWENGLLSYNTILNLDGEFSVDNANMKLKVDGKEISYIEPDFNGFFAPCSMYQNYAGLNEPSDTFGIDLRFERFDYENAKDIVLEITENDGNVISVDLK